MNSKDKEGCGFLFAFVADGRVEVEFFEENIRSKVEFLQGLALVGEDLNGGPKGVMQLMNDRYGFGGNFQWVRSGRAGEG